MRKYKVDIQYKTTLQNGYSKNIHTYVPELENPKIKSTFHQTFLPTQHKGRRLPLHLIDKVEKELQKLIEDKQIKK